MYQSILSRKTTVLKISHKNIFTFHLKNSRAKQKLKTRFLEMKFPAIKFITR